MDDSHLPMLSLILAGGRVAPRKRLLERHGTAAAALAAGETAWRDAGLEADAIARLRRPDSAAVTRAMDWFLDSPGHHLIGWDSPDYPTLLRRSPSPPLALFVDGNPDVLWQPGIAIVGSRNPTAGGRDNARDFAMALARSGLCINSGLAAGIDACAHEAALSLPDAASIAVVGTGLDLTYPARHAGLHRRIATRGAVVSEHPPGTPPIAAHFPSRNRILAGLSLGTLVVEAAARSGALITARQAAEAGREVFALPGSIHNPLARGCHRLIRDGAALLETADEAIAALAPVAAELATALRGRLASAPAHPHLESACSRPMPKGDYHNLWNALGHDPTPMDELVQRTGLTSAILSSMLLVMELDGQVAVEHGRYSRKS
jgi:DNA processing protein